MQLPAISLGFWHNFGSIDNYENGEQIVLRAWDLGVTHFDLANNYGPVAGSAETNFGRILHNNLLSHRYDPNTPIEETMQALVDIVLAGKALYVGISNYPAEQQQQACDYLKAAHVPCLIGQYRANMFDDRTLKENLPVARKNGMGFICFSPLAQGLLTDRYLNGIPKDSRAASGRGNGAIDVSAVTEEKVQRARALNEEAKAQGLSLSQYALQWLLDHKGVTSVLIGASSVRQLEANMLQ